MRKKESRFLGNPSREEDEWAFFNLVGSIHYDPSKASMVRTNQRSTIAVDIKSNRLNIALKGIVTKKEFENIYTDVRFGVADLQQEFDVVCDFTECWLMYLNGLAAFRQIFNFILSSNCGEIVRVLNPGRLISKQVVNVVLHKKGYEPLYAATLDEAEEKINSSKKWDALRFELKEQPVEIFQNEQNFSGHILNISTSGCLMTSDTYHPQMGDQLEVQFALTAKTGSDAFNLRAAVVKTESDAFAIRYSDLDSHQKSMLWKSLVNISEGEVR